MSWTAADIPDQDGRTAVVTGANGGLGLETARALAGAGAHVVMAARNQDKAAAAVEDIRGEVPDASLEIVALDLSSQASVRDAAERINGAHDRIDILVNNAGVAPTDPAEDVTEANFDLTLGVNVKGVFFASQAAGRAMIGQGFGRIVSLSSQAGFVALPTESVYCMSKAAVAHLTKCLAVEWGRHGITVNAVAPTFIRTPGTESALADPAFEAETLERIAGLHRIGEPMDVAGAVVFLASPAASLITGHTILIDGGWTAR
jgi:NAD(P)-dependent dehydrogenase (short-subunit alcohol dehydrogenase family)